MDTSRFDEGQKRAMLVSRNAAVRAGAGSGKTTVLAARYLHLVKERGFPVESILALTFTNKAASQMFERIHKELSSDPEAGRGLGSFSEAEISTFDAFCARVARSCCGSWGFSPDFSPGGQEAELVASECMAFILEKRQEPVMARLLGVWGLAGLRDGILAPAASRMGPAGAADFSAMPARMRSILEDCVAEGRKVLEASRSFLLDLGPGTKTLENLRGILRPALPRSGDDAGLLELCHRLLAPKVLHSGWVGAEFHDTCLELKAALSQLAGALTARVALPDYEGLYPLLEQLKDRIVAAKRRSGILSFSDVAAMALEGLRRDQGLRDFYRARFRAIMVDEFQDDNQLQKDVIDLLAPPPGGTEPRPDILFYVGDEKQSIYRFRGADVRVFSRLARQLEGDDPSLALSVNYRSEPALVDFTNALFEGVMAGASEDYEARFSPAASRAPCPGLRPRMLRLVQKKAEDPVKELSGDESEAWRIARFVKAAVEGAEPLMVRDKAAGAGQAGKPAIRRARYGDFALLFRSYARQALFERFFRLEGVPYAAETLRSFYREAPFADFHNVLRLCLLPGDTLALAAYLRSPFAQLSDDSLAIVLAFLAAGGSDDGPASLLPLAQEPVATNACAVGSELPDLGAAERRKLSRALDTLRSVAAMADRRSLASIVDWLWTEAGYRFSLLRDPDLHSYLEYQDYLFALAERADRAGQGIAAFAASLQGLAGSEERLDDFSPPLEREEGVALMTIHKAKGLEFPIVILPCMESPPGGGGRGKAGSWDEAGIFSFPTSPRDDEGEASLERGADYFSLRRAEREKDFAAAELKRLFYVACTRAECHLVFSEVEPGSKDQAMRTLRGLLESNLARVEARMETIVSEPLPRTEYRALLGSQRQVAGLDTARAALSSARVLDLPPRPREFSATELNALYAESQGLAAAELAWDAEPFSEPGDGEDAAGAAFGSLVHLILQRSVEAAARGGGAALGDPVMPRAEDLPPAVADWLAEGGRAAKLEEAQRLASAFLSSELMARALRAPGGPRAEEPFLLRKVSGGREYFVRGVIDLLFREGDTAVVVDYKTNQRAVEGEYALQMALYREAAAALCGLPKAESWLHYLRSGGPVAQGAEVDCGPVAESLMEKR